MQCEQRTLVNLSYGPNAPKAPEVMKDHLAWALKLMKSGEIVFAGPATNGEGGVAIYQSSRWEDVEAVAKNDPFVVAGVLAIQSHKPFWACTAAPAK